MFNSKLRRCLVAFGTFFLSVVGYYFYNSHVEFREFMRGYLEFQKTFLDTEGGDTERAQNSLDNADGVTNDSTTLGEQHWSTYDKQEWETYWSNQKPVKVRYAKTGLLDDVDITTVVHESPVTYYTEDLVPQMVETPDGKVRKMYWFEKLKPGQSIPHPQDWPVMMQVTVDGVTYDVPEGETSDSYIDKIKLSTMYDISLEDVGKLIEEGVIPSSPIEAQDDPLFDDPLFSKREDSRPLEHRSEFLPWGPPPVSEIVYLDRDEIEQLIEGWGDSK